MNTIGFQFKIVLQNVTPQIWRRIIVPKNIDMADFAYAIMDSMQWYGIRLYRFHIDKSLLMPDYTWRYYDKRICYFNYLEDFINTGCDIEFEYNVRNTEDELGWMHTLEYEGEVNFDKDISICIDGEMACPPDDVDYEKGYLEFLKIVMNYDEPEKRYDELDRVFFDVEDRLDFHPHKFDITKVSIRKDLPYDVMWKDFPLEIIT